MRTALTALVFVVALAGLHAGDKPARPLGALLNDLKNRKGADSWEVRAEAADGLAELGKKARAESDEKKQHALLARLKREAGSALTEALRDPDEDVRESAAAAVGWIGLDTHEAVTRLVELLKDKKHDMRETVAVALGQIGRLDWEKHPGIPALLPLLQAAESEVREAAAEALCHLGPLPSSSVKPLLKALEDENQSVRIYVVEALGDIGPAAKEAVEPVLKVFQDRKKRADKDDEAEHRRLRAQAAESLGFIEAKQLHVVKALAAALKNKAEPAMIRHAAADALGNISAHDEIAVPALLDILKDRPAPGDKTTDGMRVAAARALGDYFDDRKKADKYSREARAALEAVVKEPGHAKLTEAAKAALNKVKK